MSFYLKDMSNDSESKNLYTLVCATVLKASIANIDLLVYEAEETASLLGQAIVSGTDLANDVDIYTIDQLLKALKEKANLNQNQYDELLSFNKHYILGMALLILQSSIYSSYDFDITYVLDTAKSVYNRREYILKYLQIASDYEHSRLPIKAEEENAELNIYDYYKNVHTPQNIFQITSDGAVASQLQSESGRTSLKLELDLDKQYNDIFFSTNLPESFYISSLAFTAARHAHTLVNQLRNVGVQRCFLFNSFEHLEDDTASEISSLESIYEYNTGNGAITRKKKIFNSAIGATFIARTLTNYSDYVTIDQTTMEKDLFKKEIRNDINYIARRVECSYEIRDQFESGYIDETTGKLESFYLHDARCTAQYLLNGQGTYGSNKTDSELKALNNKRQFIGYNYSSTLGGLQDWYARAMRRLMSDAHKDDVQESIASFNINLAMTEDPNGSVKKRFNYTINRSFEYMSVQVYNKNFKLNRNVIINSDSASRINAAWYQTLKNLVSNKFSESLLVSGLSDTINKYCTSISLDILFGYIFSQKTANNEIFPNSLSGMISPLLQTASNIHNTYTSQNNEYSKEQHPFLERYYTGNGEGAKARISFVDNRLVNVDYRKLEKEIRNTLNMNMLLEAYCKNKDDSLKTIVNKAWCLISDFLLLHKQTTTDSEEAGNFGKNRSSFSDAAKDHVDSLTFKKMYLQSFIGFIPTDGMTSVMKILENDQYSHYNFYNDIESSYKSLLLKIFSEPIVVFNSISRVSDMDTSKAVVQLKCLQNDATINREFVTHRIIENNKYTGRTTLLDIYNSDSLEEIETYVEGSDINLRNVYRRPTRKVFIYPGYTVNTTSSYRISSSNFTWDDFSFDSFDPLNTKYVTPEQESIKLAYYEKLFAMPSVKYDASPPAFYNGNYNYESTLEIKPYYIKSDSTRQYIDIDNSINFSTIVKYGSISRMLYGYGFNAIPLNMRAAEKQTGGYFSKNILTTQYKGYDFKIGISRRYKLLYNAHRMYTNSYIAGIATSLRPTFFTFTPDRLIDDETRIDVSGMNQEQFKICSEEKLIKYVSYDGDGLTNPNKPISTYTPIWRKGSDNNYYNALHPYALPPIIRDGTSYDRYSLKTYAEFMDVTSYDATCGFMTMLDAVQTGCGNLLYSYSQDNYIYKNIFNYNTSISRNIIDTDTLFKQPDTLNLYNLEIDKSKIIIGSFLNTNKNNYFNNILIPILNLMLTDYVKLQKNYYNVYVFNKQDFIRRGSPDGLSITNFSSAHGIYQIEKIVNNFYEYYTVQNFTKINSMNDAEFETFCKNYIDALEAVRSSQSVHVSEQVSIFLSNFDINTGKIANNVENLNCAFNTLMTSCALEILIDYIKISFAYAIDSVNRRVQANVGKLKSDLVRQIYDNFLKIDILRKKILDIAEQTVENFYKQILDLIDEFEPTQKTFDEMYKLDEFKVLKELFKWKGKDQ